MYGRCAWATVRLASKASPTARSPPTFHGSTLPSSCNLLSAAPQALVRAAAWRALAAALDLLPMRLRRSRALPLLLQQCRDPEHHAEVHRSLTAGLGALMARLVADMEGDAEVNACLGYFRSQAWRHDHATRLNCAAAFPAVLRAGTARRYGSHLHDTFLRLASDADAEVRLAAAAALPDVAASLGRDRCCQYLRQPVAALLQDERQEVQACLLGRLPEVLQHFCLGAPEEARTKVLASFVDPLLRLEAVSGYSWRLQLALLQALAAFPAFFSPDQLYERFLPLAWKYMGEGVAAVREAAAAAAAAVWRALRKPPHRTALYARAVLDFGQVGPGAVRHRGRLQQHQARAGVGIGEVAGRLMAIWHARGARCARLASV